MNYTSCLVACQVRRRCDEPSTGTENPQQAARRAARAWSLRPGPLWTFLKELRYPETAGQLLRIGLRYLSWIGGRD
jgi:anaerobic magnesium-protoporphyrin IX monomethyl ester cyclase